MTRCYLKRSSKTAVALMLGFIMVLAMLDTRSRYNTFMMSMESSDSYPPSELGVKRGGVIRLNLPNPSNKTELFRQPHQPYHDPHNELDSTGGEEGEVVEKNEIGSPHAALLTSGGQFPTDNGSLTLRFWSLVNGSSKSEGSFSESAALPSLWRPEVFSSNFLLEGRDDDRVLSQLIWGMEATNLSEASGRSPSMKTIYLPDSFRWWGKTKWRSPHALEEEDCPGNPGILRKCSFSQSRESMDALITVRDAFHTRDFSVPSNVLRFYFMLESPIFSHATFRRTNDLMATFYRGSDVNTPYGKWVYFDPAVRFKDQEKDYAKGKSKMAAIFTSNCHPWNNRMGFVRELQKYVEVDVFGACGQKNCPRYNQKECYDMLKRDYRFYLSFENSNCRDYVTEKLFTNAFENDVIPIVLGAHPSDYKAMCPDKSYIHVEDFPSPKELADYMHRLADSPQEYNSYFRWRNTGKFVDTNFFCRVCAMVHYADIVAPPERRNPYAWNSEVAITNKICLPSGAWYWNRAKTSSPAVIVKNRRRRGS